MAVLIARDFTPKPPTRTSAIAAAPLFLLALASLVLLIAPGTWGEGWALSLMTAEYVVLFALLVLSLVRDGEGSGWSQYVLFAFYALVFLGMGVAFAFGARDAGVLVGMVLGLGGRWRDLLKPRRFLARSLTAARSALGLALAWVLLVPAYAFFGEEGAAAWAFLHFALQGGLDLFGVLTPDATVEAADAPAAPA